MKKLNTLFVLAILASFFFANKALAQSDQELIGKDAPSFKLKNIDGKMVSLADYKSGKGAIVIFTCNHCPYSKLYEDRIIAIDKQFKGQGFPVVAINPNDVSQYPEDSYGNMKKRAKEKGFTFPYLVDDSQAIAQAYGATRTPHVFLVVNEGDKQVVRYVGAIDDNAQEAASVETKFVEDAIAKVVAGQQPEPNYTKAIGCGIKWKKS